MTAASSVIQVQGLAAGYGRNQVLSGVSFSVPEGQICGLVGPNGAGKTTLFRAMYGLLPLTAGRVLLAARDVSGLPVRERLSLGIGYVPQERNVFPNLTVEENLELAGSRIRQIEGGDALRSRLDYVFELFPRLAERRAQQAGLMSGGEQRMVALGIGLIPRPRILLLDEPTTGLAPIFVQLLMQTIQGLRREHGITSIVVEQNIASLSTIADTILIMKEGALLADRLSGEELATRKIWEYL